nr:tetratricopeptide repeat protein [Bacteroidales bacterium]
MNKCFFLCLTWLAVLPASVYIDHRGHNLDSLERAVARWTPDAVDRASTEELIELNRAYRDLMLGYNVLNGEKSDFYARKALAISQAQGWVAADEDAYRYIGLHFYGRGQYDSAMVYFRAALSATERMAAGAVSPTAPEGYTEQVIDDAFSSLYGTIGNIYNVMDSIPQAMAYYEKAGAIFDKHGWNESNSVLYYNIGETWMDEGDLKQAVRAYDRALGYAEASGDSLMMVNVYKGLGRLYMERGENRKSLTYLRKADAYYAAHPDDSPEFRTENLDFIKEVLSRQKLLRGRLV